jgi:hypothetical protein
MGARCGGRRLPTLTFVGSLIQKNLEIERDSARIAIECERKRKTDEITRLQKLV